VHAVTRAQCSLDDPRIHWHVADLLDKKQVAELMSRVEPSQLLHLAWYSVPGKFWTSLQNLQWLQASLNLIEEFAVHGGKRIVATGSCAEYSWDGDGILSESSTPIVPATLYGACKHALHTVVEALARQMDLSLAWGRVFFLYGPGEHPDRLTASVIRSLIRGEPAVCSEGRQMRDFLYVQDAAAGLVALLRSEVSGPVNIASGQGVAVKDMVRQVAEIIGRHDLIRLGEREVKPGEPPILVADVKRLHDEIGFQPQHSLESGLRQAIEWWRHHLELTVSEDQNAIDD
jgi:nucleoside-diphosphate-sugar epimerase